MQSLLKALSQNKTLVTLDLEGCKIHLDTSVPAALPTCWLTSLNMSRLGIVDASMALLLTSLHDNVHLRELSLKQNKLDSRQVRRTAVHPKMPVDKRSVKLISQLQHVSMRCQNAHP